jgi:hypothetical protein
MRAAAAQPGRSPHTSRSRDASSRPGSG